MKKLTAILVLGLALGTASLFADHPSGFGIGVNGGWSGGLNGGLGGGALTLKIPSLPVFWYIDLDAGGLGVAGDYYFIDKTLVGKLGWYLGLGAFGYFGVWGSDTVAIAVGARLPIGLSWQPIDLLEIYLQVVPSIALKISPDIGMWPNFFGGNLGIRLWF